jgi:hypothetical protein
LSFTKNFRFARSLAEVPHIEGYRKDGPVAMAKFEL